jgi:RNA polymerase-interacting CarD/CdnL/TRCF family regulator
MQNILEICKEFGLEVPTDKQADFSKKVAENYKTVSEVDKKTSKLETERDSWKERAETAENTLKGFEGKNLDEITKERDAWKKKAEDAEKDYSDKMAAHEKRELLKEAFADIEFTSESAKKAIMSQIEEGVTVKNGKLIGFNDLLEDAKKNDASAFVDKEDQNLNQNKARFTNPANNQNNGAGGTLTKKDIMAIKDPVERQKKIGENLSLFQ